MLPSKITHKTVIKFCIELNSVTLFGKSNPFGKGRILNVLLRFRRRYICSIYVFHQEENREKIFCFNFYVENIAPI